MSDLEPSGVFVVRHGATEWSRDGRHTSTTDLPLLPEGEDAARALAPRLAGLDPALVLASPRERARRTAELAGFEPEPEPGLAEWAYGEYEGVTTPEIRETVPGWTVWSHPCPGGESAEEVTERLDRVIGRVRPLVQDGDRVLLVGHGHAMRGLGARWLGLPVTEGRLWTLDTARVSVLGFERDQPVVLRWNG